MVNIAHITIQITFDVLAEDAKISSVSSVVGAVDTGVLVLAGCKGLLLLKMSVSSAAVAAGFVGFKESSSPKMSFDIMSKSSSLFRDLLPALVLTAKISAVGVRSNTPHTTTIMFESTDRLIKYMATILHAK